MRRLSLDEFFCVSTGRCPGTSSTRLYHVPAAADTCLHTSDTVAAKFATEIPTKLKSKFPTLTWSITAFAKNKYIVSEWTECVLEIYSLILPFVSCVGAEVKSATYDCLVVTAYDAGFEMSRLWRYCSLYRAFVWFRISAGPLPGNSLRQAAHTHVPPSPSSIIWYRLVSWEGNRRSGGK